MVDRGSVGIKVNEEICRIFQPNNFVKSNSRDNESVVETMHKPSTQKVTLAKLVKKFALKIFTIELAHEFGTSLQTFLYFSPFPTKE